jgi:hypothetical protein
MATTESEIKIDLDAADAEAAKKDTKRATTDTKDANLETIEVKKADSDAKTDTREVLTPDAGLEKLKKQLADEQLARQDADRRAADASRAEVEARSEVQTTQLDLVKNAISSVTQANDALEAKYAEALTAQDFAAAAKINREMSSNSAKLLQLENGKSALEKAPKPQPRAASDPIEEFAGRLSPKSGAWVRAHPEFVREPQKNRQMLAAHELALARGMQADTDDYFASIEDTLRITKPDASANGAGTHVDVDTDPMKDAAKESAPRRAPPAAAPVSRSGAGTGGSRQNVVTLSAQEVEIAGMMNMTPEEYARQKVALKREGRLQ